MCPASGTKVALGEVVDVTTVLLAGAEEPCCAAAARIREEDKTMRESCMVRADVRQRIGEEERLRGETKEWVDRR